MEYLKSQFARLRKRLRHVAPLQLDVLLRPVALESFVLGKIPLELLIQITEHLPAPSAAAFSISCMQIKRLIGDQHLKTLAGQPADTLALLELLALDLPNQIVCPSCLKLHEMENAGRYIMKSPQQRVPPQCVVDDWRALVEMHIGHNFSSTVFRMAMKRYQDNPGCSQLMRLLSANTDTRPGFSYVSQSRAECRIIQGLMIYCVQEIFVSSTSSTSSSFTTHPFFEICAHLHFETDTHSASVYTYYSMDFAPVYQGRKTIWSTTWDLTAPERHNTGSGLMRCNCCGTESRIDFKYFPGQGMAMFFTRWKNLGTGPDDDVWKLNFEHHSSFPSMPFRFPLGVMSSAFEDFKSDSLLSPENKSELFRVQNKLLDSRARVQWKIRPRGMYRGWQVGRGDGLFLE